MAECTGDKEGLHFDGRKFTGVFDTLFLCAYAAGLFVRSALVNICSRVLTIHILTIKHRLCSGTLAERSNLRLYLFVGMAGACQWLLRPHIAVTLLTGSALCCALLGMAEILNIHVLWYFLFVTVCVLCCACLMSNCLAFRRCSACFRRLAGRPWCRRWATGSRRESKYFSQRDSHSSLCSQARPCHGCVELVQPHRKYHGVRRGRCTPHLRLVCCLDTAAGACMWMTCVQGLLVHHPRSHHAVHWRIELGLPRHA